ncbi:MAG: hypothetical protein WEF53_05085 [Bacteroidota bacterium]
MKKVTAYVNTLRVHWLVEELEAMGIGEIMVTEYFSPSSNISRMELFSEDRDVENVRDVIHRIGTTGEAGDHSFFMEEYDPKLPGLIPFGRRTSKLEETRVKQLVNFLLRGTHGKIRSAFLILAISVIAVGLFAYAQSSMLQRSAEDSLRTIAFISDATGTLESAVLAEMLAVERSHRGERTVALGDFREARSKLLNAIEGIRRGGLMRPGMADSLQDLEHRFHHVADGMFGMFQNTPENGLATGSPAIGGVYESHAAVMSMLDAIRADVLRLLSSFEDDTRLQTSFRQQQMIRSIDSIRLSLLLLAVGTIVATAMVWLMVERKVSRPIRRLIEESRTYDTTQLQ